MLDLAYFTKLGIDLRTLLDKKISNLKIHTFISDGYICFDITVADLKFLISKGGSVRYFLVDGLDELIKKCIELEGSVYRGNPKSYYPNNRSIWQCDWF